MKEGVDSLATQAEYEEQGSEVGEGGGEVAGENVTSLVEEGVTSFQEENEGVDPLPLIRQHVKVTTFTFDVTVEHLV